MAPETILRDLLALDPGLQRERYYGEQAVFYNPGRMAPLGVIFASIKDHDGPNDRRANLSRPASTASPSASRLGPSPTCSARSLLAR
jgi:hypothetical protein